MFKFKLISCCFLLTTMCAVAQVPVTITNLQQQIASAKNDSTKVDKLLKLATMNLDFTNVILVANKALTLANTLNYTKGKADAYNALADAYWYHSDYDKAQQNYFKAYEINDAIKGSSKNKIVSK